MGLPQRWLTLVYKVPAEPARVRAAVWRRLRSIGAIYLQDGTAALPASPAAERALRTLQAEIVDGGGTGYLMASEMIAGESEIVTSYNRARDEEYMEIVAKCRDFEQEIRNETAACHFTYAELEENDEDLTKLRTWLEKVRGRDALGAEQGPLAVESVAACGAMLEQFAQRVYDAEGNR